MRLLKQISIGAIGVVVLALVLAAVLPKAAHAIVSTLVTIANTTANPVPVQVVKQSTGNLVNLVYDPNNLVWDQLLPNGTLAPYSIPAGEQLIITDMNWEAICTGVPGAGNNYTPCLSKPGDGVALLLQFNSTNSYWTGSYFSQATFTTDNDQMAAGKSESFKSGIVTNQLPTPAFLQPCGNCGVGLLALNLNGYLLP